MQDKLDPLIFVSPWRDVQADGTLGAPFGPSPATFARQHAAYRDHFYRRITTPSKVARSADMETLARWMRPNGELRGDQPPTETTVFLMTEMGHSTRWIASKLKISRRTVRSRLARLAEKAGQG